MFQSIRVSPPSTPLKFSTSFAVSFALSAAILAIAVGAAVLLGWIYDIALLKSVLPTWVAMKANTAVCFVAIGLAILSTAPKSESLNPKIARTLTGFGWLCALISGLIGLLTLGEYLLDWNPGLDQWLFIEPPDAVGTSFPGRMAPETAVCFLVLAIALWLGRLTGINRWTVLATTSIGLVVLTLALAAMLSYFTPQLGAFGWFGQTIMAMHTSILFVLLGMATIAIGWRQESLQWSLSKANTLALICALLLLVLVGLNTSRAQFWLKDINQRIASNEKVLGDIENLQDGLIHTQTSARGYLMTGDERFLQSQLSAKADSLKQLEELRSAETKSPEAIHRQHFVRLESAVDALLQWHRHIIDARDLTAATRDEAATHGQRLLEAAREAAATIQNEHSKYIHQAKKHSDGVLQIAYSVITIGTAIGLSIFLMVIFRLNFAVHERSLAEAHNLRIAEELRQLNEALEARVKERTMQLETANAALAVSVQDLARSNLELEQFAYVASHDLQEPLRMVVGFVQLLEKRLADKLDAETAEFMKYAIDGALRMQRLIQDILMYSRVSSRGGMPERIDSAKALQESLTLLAGRIRQSDAHIEAQTLPTVLADHTQLVQLFQNLIGNALKFCREGPPQVRIDACKQGAFWHFSIVDNGVGIAAEYRERIFGIFQRLHTRKEYEGTGIGLAVCKRIVQRHGGEIGVDSAPDGGSIFWFTLPEEKNP